MGHGGGRSGAAEQGAAALERVGLMFAAALVVLAVAAGINGAQLLAVVGHAVRQILGQADCPPQAPTATPLEQATWGEYGAMGDSYASGDGAGDYAPDTDYDRGDDWDRDNWGDDERNDRIDGEGPQLEALDEDVSLGGNDLGFSTVVEDCISSLLYAEDQEWMNEQAAELNDVLRSAARESGVEFIDPTVAFRGHGIGSDDPWINDLNWGGPGLSLVDPGSFHPNAQGQAAIADLLEKQIKEPEYT